MNGYSRTGYISPGPIWPQWQSGRYYATPWSSATPSTSANLGVGTLRLSPFDVPNTITITRIGCEITSAGDAGSKVRLGIYADDRTGRPSALLLDAGVVAADAIAVPEITDLTLTIGPGRYWVAAAVQIVTATQPTVRVVNSIMVPVDGPSAFSGTSAGVGYSQGSVTGALPTTFSSTTVSGVHPRMFIKT